MAVWSRRFWREATGGAGIGQHRLGSDPLTRKSAGAGIEGSSRRWKISARKRCGGFREHGWRRRKQRRAASPPERSRVRTQFLHRHSQTGRAPASSVWTVFAWSGAKRRGLCAFPGLPRRVAAPVSVWHLHEQWRDDPAVLARWRGLVAWRGAVQVERRRAKCLPAPVDQVGVSHSCGARCNTMHVSHFWKGIGALLVPRGGCLHVEHDLAQGLV